MGTSRNGIGGWKWRTTDNHRGSTGKHWTLSEETRCHQGDAQRGRIHHAATRRKLAKAACKQWAEGRRIHPNSLAALRRGAVTMAERRRGTGEYEGRFTWTLRSLVWKRDGSRCRLCGRRNEKGRGRALVVHHLDYDRSHNELDNLVLLCRGCHLGGHSRGAWPIGLAAENHGRPMAPARTRKETMA